MLGNEAIHGTPGFVTWECDAMTAMFLTLAQVVVVLKGATIGDNSLSIATLLPPQAQKNEGANLVPTPRSQETTVAPTTPT